MIENEEDDPFLRDRSLDGLGLIHLVPYPWPACGIKIDRNSISPTGFDSLQKIVNYVISVSGVRKLV